MIKSLMTAVLGTRHERERKRLQPLVDRIHAEEEKLQPLSEARTDRSIYLHLLLHRTPPLVPSGRTTRRW